MTGSPTARDSDPASQAAARFSELFGPGPAPRCVRAPGRVNLIGEHIDYCDLPVLPMALGEGLSLSFRARSDGVVRLASTAAGREPRRFELAGHIAPSPAGDWANYAKAAAQALVRDLGLARGIDALVHSDLPAEAGLSSSAALVVACSVALLAAGERALEPLQLAEFCAQAERYVGTRGGGMDQAASVLARPGHALRVEFAPLRVTHLTLPADWSFVVADSGVRAAKSGALRAAYNRLRGEAEEIARRLHDARADPCAPSWPALLAGTPAARLLERAEECLDNRLLARFRHIAGEAQRVERACRALADSDAATFGALLTRSHASLRDDLGVSHQALERLVELALAGGARGARLTGAGFGGSIVALVDSDRAAALVEHLQGAAGVPAWIARGGAGASLDGRPLALGK